MTNCKVVIPSGSEGPRRWSRPTEYLRGSSSSARLGMTAFSDHLPAANFLSAIFTSSSADFPAPSHQSVENLRILAHVQMRENFNRLSDSGKFVVTRKRNKNLVANTGNIDRSLRRQRVH